MNKNIKLASIVPLILLHAAFIFGQDKTLNKTEFQSIVEKATAGSEQINYRAIRNYETFEEGNSVPVTVSKSVTERSASGDYRWISESNGKKYEMIMVGGKMYDRDNNGNWKINNSGGSGISIPCGVAIISETYKITPDIQFNSKKADIYEETRRLGVMTCGEEERRKGAEIVTQKYWIAKDGLLLKRESITEEIEKKSLEKDTTTYEYDPSIKITSPIKQQK